MAASLLPALGVQAAPVPFNLGWRFHLGEVPGAEAAAYDDRAWRRVDLPHDWSIEAPVGVDPRDRSAPEGDSVGYFRGGIGWYRNTFTLAPEQAGQAVDLVFDGVQQESEVWINGHYLGLQPHGYIPFHYDLTPYLAAPGRPNLVAVRATNPERNSRWYSGSGLYRPVALEFHDPLHVLAGGVLFDTLSLGADKAELQVRVGVRNDRVTPERLSLALTLSAPGGATQSFDLGLLTVAAGTTEQASEKISVAGPLAWSIATPNLYQGEIQLLQGGRVIDSRRQSFGIRTVAVSAEQGFLLNGQPIKLKGACLHHDNGLLGAAAFARAEYRRVGLMKRNGFNAIRTSHNPPSADFLAACDELGLLVIDEFADTWELPKKVNGYNRYFAQHWERDLRAMVARDYNHPSVVIWSIGNEIPERAQPAGLTIAGKLIAGIRQLDRRRPITNALCEFWDNPEWTGQWDPSAPAFALLDVGGYNYCGHHYESDHAKFPARVMVGTESYPKDAYSYWQLVSRHPYVIGDFVWTGMDHLGESGIGHNVYVDDATEAAAPKPWGLMPWPTWVNWCGDLDLIGNKKPQSYFRDVVWDRSRIELAVHAPIPPGQRELVSQWGWPDELPSWNWPDAPGRTLQVRVFAKAARVRLELNGRVVGEQAIDREKDITATFAVPYEPGTLRASALEGDQVVASCTLQTTGAAAAITLRPELSGQRADRGELIFVPIEINDAAGRVVPDAVCPLEAEVTGPAGIQAFGSANPVAAGPLQGRTTQAFRGRALVVLRPTGRAGVVTLRVKSAGLPVAQADVTLPAAP